MRSISNLS
jgi:hypothetical protein